jgi:uncharacterized protein DUF6894
MALYNYDIAGDYPFQDEEGINHVDDESAWRDAVRFVRDIEEYLHPNGRWILTVRNGDRCVYTIEVLARLCVS